MITLYTISAGMVAITFAISLVARNTPSLQRSSDERGITLQTLIVTTVLVLMAVAAGVVIMAITNSANDRLRGQQTDQDAPCEPWEVHDIGLESAGRGGGQGGIVSSAIGCRRVCYIENQPVGALSTTAITEISSEKNMQSTLTFDRSAKNVNAGKDNPNGAKAILVVNGLRTATATITGASATTNGANNLLDMLTTIDGPTKEITVSATTETWQFQVHASGNYCEIIDTTQTTTNQRQILRS